MCCCGTVFNSVYSIRNFPIDAPYQPLKRWLGGIHKLLLLQEPRVCIRWRYKGSGLRRLSVDFTWKRRNYWMDPRKSPGYAFSAEVARWVSS